MVGVQAEACAPYIDSLAAHRPIGARSANTICDGIAVKRPGEFTLPLVERYLDEVVTVSDDAAAEAMVLLLERNKVVVEGAGAVAVAALMHCVEGAGRRRRLRRLSGGNVDASLLYECIRLGETAAGRRIVFSTVVPDRPGALARLLRLIAEHGGNLVDVEHLRDGIDLHVRETAIKLVLQTRGPGRQRGDPPGRARRGLPRARRAPRGLALRRQPPCLGGAGQLVDLGQLVLAEAVLRRRGDALDCAGRRAPAIATCTPGWASTQRDRDLRERVVALLGEGLQRSTASRLRSSASPANGSWPRRQSSSASVDGSNRPLSSPCESGP